MARILKKGPDSQYGHAPYLIVNPTAKPKNQEAGNEKSIQMLDLISDSG